MNDPVHSDDERALSEADARAIIGRALRLQDQLAGEVTLRDVRIALSELGVSETTFRAALSEVDGPVELARFTPLPVVHAATAGVALGAGGATLVSLFAGLGPITFLMGGSVFMISGVLAVRNRPSTSTLKYQAANAALWLGCGVAYRLVAGWAATHHMGVSTLLYSAPFVFGWAFTAVVGAAIANYRVDTDCGAQPTGVTARVRRAVARAIRRILDFVDPSLRTRASSVG